MVIAGAFEDVERSVNLLGEDQSRQVMRKDKLAEFDGRILLSQLLRETIGSADRENDFAAGLGECFFYVVRKPAACEGFSPFVAQNQGVAWLDEFHQRLRFLGFLGFGVGRARSRQELDFHRMHRTASLYIIVTERIDFRVFVVFDGRDEDHVGIFVWVAKGVG